MTKWTRDFVMLAAPYRPRVKLDEPLRLDILAVLPRPQRLAKGAMAWCTARPDEDNIRKAVKDGLKDFWTDDSIVVCGSTLKVYAETGKEPKITVRIRSARPPLVEALETVIM